MQHRTRTFRRQNRGALIAATVVALVAAALLVPSTATAQDSTLEEIYAALRPADLRTTSGRTAYAQGESIEFMFDLVNTSNQPLVIPLTDFFGRSFHLVGTEQSWIERLGPDPTIPSISPFIARKGTWYASGGQIAAVEGLPLNTIAPGARVLRQAMLIHSTAGFPAGRYRFHLEYKPLLGGLDDVIAEVALDLTIGDVPTDETAPVITLPGNMSLDATGPRGAIVSYSASATDDVDGSVPVTCAPASGSMFAIGTTTVECSAADEAGNEASASFDVRVKGAAEQLGDLSARMDGLGPGTSIADKLAQANAALAAGNRATACQTLAAVANEAQAQSGRKLTAAQAAELIASANRIRAVLGC